VARLTALAVSLATLAGPVSAQSGASVHLAITGGAHPGTFDVQTAEACVAEDSGGWSLVYYDETLVPATVELQMMGAGGFDSLLIMFDDGEGYLSVELDAEVEHIEGTTILAVTAPAGDLSGLGGDTATIELRIDCGGAAEAETLEPTEAPLPTPRIQGPPEAGSTVFHLTLDFGPWAGEYDAWTLEQACSADDVGWSASFVNPGSIPSSVSLISVDVEGEDAPVVVSSVTFGAFPDLTLYETSTEASIELDAERGMAQVHDADATVILPDLTESTGSLDVSIECAPVVP
jgi:hypothetical protein